MTDHDLLIRIDERTETMSKQFSNHVRYHWVVSIPVLLMVLGLLAAVLTE